MRAEHLETGIGYNPAFLKRIQAQRERAAKLQEIEDHKALVAAEKEAARRALAHLEYRAINVITDDKPSLRRIIEAIAMENGYTFADITGTSRKRHLVRIRQQCYRAAREARPDLSLPAIARIFKKDHTTVLHGLRKAATFPDISNPIGAHNE